MVRCCASFSKSRARVSPAVGQDDPTQAPAGHAEILGEAVHHDDLAGQAERGDGNLAVDQPLVNLVDDEHAAPLRDEARDFPQFRRRDHGPGRIGRRAEQQSACAPAPRRAHLRQHRLEVRRRRNSDRPGAALEAAHHVTVARITRVGHQDLVAGVDVQRQRQQQAARSTGGDGDPFRGYFYRKSGPVMRRNRLAQLGQAERRGVGGASVAQRLDRGFDHLRRRGEVGLADLHVDHAPAGGFDRMRARQHVHHHERLDFCSAPGGATDGGNACLGRQGEKGIIRI